MTMEMQTVAPSQAHGLTVGPRPWAALDGGRNPRDGDQKQAAFEALLAVLRSKGISLEDGPRTSEFFQALVVDHRGKAELSIEVPVLAERIDPHAIAGAAPASDIALTADELRLQVSENVSFAEIARLRWLKTTPKLAALDGAGIDELLSVNSEMSRRRRVVADERAAEAAAKVAAQERAAKLEAERAEYARRYSAWRALPREAQIFVATAEAMPEFAELLAELAKQAKAIDVAMPTSWRP